MQAFSFSLAVLAAAVKYGFKGIDPEVVLVFNMPRNFIKETTAQMYKLSAFFTAQMKVFFLYRIRRVVLVAGPVASGGAVLADGSGVHQLFQMAVDSGQPYGFPGIAPEVIGYVIDRNVEIPQGSQVINNKLPLPGVIPGTGCRLSVLFTRSHDLTPS
jgi:hypothetical protein